MKFSLTSCPNICTNGWLYVDNLESGFKGQIVRKFNNISEKKNYNPVYVVLEGRGTSILRLV